MNVPIQKIHMVSKIYFFYSIILVFGVKYTEGHLHHIRNKYYDYYEIKSQNCDILSHNYGIKVEIIR